MIVFILFISVLLIRLWYHMYFFRALSSWITIKDGAEGTQGVSIVVCSKNNVEGLKELLPALLNQDYVNFEIILVDDFSSDESWQFLCGINNPKVIAMKASIDQPGKKMALSEGIAQARHDWILVTDSDCLPNSQSWVSTMMKYSSVYNVVLGYGPLQKTLGYVNHFARFETTMIALQYLSFALKNVPYMGVGRNLLYHKSLYKEVGGFSSHSHLTSGDDDLFIQSITGKSTIGICVEQAAFVYSKSKETWSKLIRQKIRHVSTSTSYAATSKLLLAMLSFSQVASWILLIFCLSMGGKIGFLTALIFSVFCLVAALNLRKPFRMLDGSDLVSKYVIMDFTLFVYYLILSPFVMYHKRQTWN